LKYGKQIARATIFVALTVAILVAFRAKGILQTIIIFNYPYMGSMLVPLLGGVLWKGATRQGAFAAMATGGVIGVGAFLLGIPSPWQGKVSIDLGLFIAYFLSLLVFVLVSLWTSQRRTLRREEEVLR
jgi:solute:Na+ symporter, SSS family